MEECRNGNNVLCESMCQCAWFRKRLATMCVFRMRGARCTAGQTATQREPAPARPEREAHPETAVEDAVCGAEAGKMC